MQIKNFIALVLAVIISGESAFAIGAVAYNETTFLPETVTGLGTNEAARTAILAKLVEEGKDDSDHTIQIVPNGMALAILRCSRIIGGAITQRTFYYRIAETREEARSEALKSCTAFFSRTPLFSFVEPPSCPSHQEVIGGNVCTTTVKSCNDINQVFNNGVCQSCSRGEIRNVNVCQITQASCNAIGQVLSSGSCSPCADEKPIFNGNSCVAASTGGATSATSAAGGGSDSSGNTFLYVGAGAAVVGLLYFFTSPGGVDGISFSPDYNYSLTENGYAYNVGGRLNYQQDNLQLYYTAAQNNSNTEFNNFRYESGAEYNNDFWKVEFSESIERKTADYGFSLGAKMDGGIWEISPTYRLHSRYENLSAGWESETKNSLNLESVLNYNRWTIKPSAGFQWENADEFGNNTQFNLSAVRRF